MKDVASNVLVATAITLVGGSLDASMHMAVQVLGVIQFHPMLSVVDSHPVIAVSPLHSPLGDMFRDFLFRDFLLKDLPKVFSPFHLVEIPTVHISRHHIPCLMFHPPTINHNPSPTLSKDFPIGMSIILVVSMLLMNTTPVCHAQYTFVRQARTYT
jgi:hypothetical protein